MAILNIEASPEEIKKYNLKTKSKMTLEELVKTVSLQKGKKVLKELNKLAKETGLAKMTMKEINAEIKAVRNAKKNSN